MVICMNKMLVILSIPLLEKEYDVYIPINKKIGTIKKIIVNSIFEHTDAKVIDVGSLKLYDRDSSILYDNDILVKDSGIKNGSRLLLM